MWILPAFAAVALAVGAGCGGHGGVTVLPNTAATSGAAAGSSAVVVNGTTAAIPVPTGLPYQTTLSLANQLVVSGTTVSESGSTSLPGGLPSLSFHRSAQSQGRSTQQLTGGSATLLEAIQLTPSQPLVGLGGLTETVTVPSSMIQSGVHFWALLCLTDIDYSQCQRWDGPFGPATVTPGTGTAQLSVTVPLAALASKVPHTLAFYSIPDGTIPSISTGMDVTSFLTNKNSPTSVPASDKHIYLSVNAGAQSPFIPKGVAYGNTPIGVNGEAAPLDVNQQALWTRDLTYLQGLHANALRAYDISPAAPSPNPTPINLASYLTTSYADGIYTVLGTTHLGGPPGGPPPTTVCTGTMDTPSPSNPTSSCYGSNIQSWITWYQSLAHKWGAYPGVMGFVIGNEINGCGSACEGNQGYWAQLDLITKAIRMGYGLLQLNEQKLVFYSAVDDTNPQTGPTPSMAVGWGEHYNSLLDVWGYDVYEGGTYHGCPTANTCFWNIMANQVGLTRPLTILEFGVNASYHPTPNPQNTATANPAPELLPHPTAAPGTYASPYPCSSLPTSVYPTFKDVVTFYACMQQGIDNYSIVNGTNGASDVGSGGFVFELADEFYKAGGGGCTYYHCAGSIGIVTNSGYMVADNTNTSLFWNDEAYLGLMSIGLAGPSYNPGSASDTRTPRETYCWFQNHWAGQYAAPCFPQIRFVNGAPSAGNVTWSVDGSSFDSNVPPSTQGTAPNGSITGYHTMQSPTVASHTITFTNSSGSLAASSCVTPVLLASSRTTVVLTGNGGSVPYACQVFDEPEVNNTTTSAIYHHAAPIYAGKNTAQNLYAYYSYWQSPTYATGLGYTPVSLGGPAVVFDSLAYYPPMGWNRANSQYTGAAFEVGATPTQMQLNNVGLLATVLPSAVDPTDTNNYMPNAVSVSQTYSGLDANMAIFVVDNASGGVSLLGTFTP